MKQKHNSKYAEAVASMVAIDWLQFAEKKIAEQQNPAKLSVIAYDQVRAIADQSYWVSKLYKANLRAIAELSVDIAKSFLQAGRYPTVRAYFRGLEHGSK